MADISVLPHPKLPQLLVVKPASYLGKTFQAYITVLRANGGQFDGDAKHHMVDITLVLELLGGLARAGFRVVPDPELLDVILWLAKCLASDARKDATRLGELDKTELYHFQRDGVVFLENNPRAALIDEMGLGKTIQALMALPKEGRTLVICPAVVKAVWAMECERWRPDISVYVAKYKASFCLPGKREVVIANYDILPELERYHEAEMSRVTLIADEAHYVKNYKARRTKRFRALAKHAERVWLLTGTPLLNRPDELWGVLEAAGLGRKAYGSWTHFRDMFDHTVDEHGHDAWGDPKPLAFEGLQRVSLRRTKQQVLTDLPEKTHRVHPVDLGNELRSECDKVMAELQALIDAGEPVEVWSNLAELMKVRKNLALRKYGLALLLIKEYETNEEPVVVFSAHRRPIELLYERNGWAAITGDMPQGVRDAAVSTFQAGHLKGLACTIQAGGVGITLTRAHHMIFIDRMWTPALNEQAEDRIHRIGQDRGCVYTHLVADHDLDALMDKTLRRKQALIGASVAKVGASDSVAQKVARLERLADQLRSKLEQEERPA